MLFNSLQFLYFFALFFVLYWISYRSVRIQNILILAGSYVFYGWWDYRFLSLIIFSTVVDYFAGRQIDKARDEGTRKFFLLLSLGINLGLLMTFKYMGFFVSSFIELLNSVGISQSPITLGIILPVGISFYTFQTMSYSIDIYNKNMKHTKDFISFAAFVSFFPHLVAGPIERASNLLPQILKKENLATPHLLRG